jgi:phosphoglycolate phosphatase-like HAD superfamily hydrolase
MSETIVFDLDGTLLSCRPRQMAALRAVSGLPLSELSAIWQLKRDGATTRDALVSVGTSAGFADEVARRWGNVIETPYFLAYDRLLPGAIEALQACRALGLKVVILTARKSGRYLLAQCHALGLHRSVDCLTSVDPRQAVAQKAQELQRLAPLGLVGDTEVDVHAAAAAGVPFFSVSSGQRSSDFLRRMLGLTPFEGVLPATLAALVPVTG